MRIIIATSGNGGHLFCGLGIAEALKKRIGNANLFFLGSGGRLTRKLVEAKDFKFYKVYASGLLRKGIMAYANFIFGQIINLMQSGLLFLYIRPRVVVSTGGFASIGIVFWSFIFNRPCVVHEQNLIPGKVNRLSAYIADKILISFKETKEYFRKRKCVFTGIPIRFTQPLHAGAGFTKQMPKEEAKRKLGLDSKKFTILIMGGSHGAHRINQIIISILEKLPRDTQFIHLTGTQDLNLVREAYKKNNFCAFVESFSTEMDVLYSASNLVISRAGSGTISEITFFGLPCILIPYPYSRDRHQYKNAEYLAQKGAAIVMPEENMSIDKLIELVKSQNRIREMAQHSADLADKDAAGKIVDEIMEYINE